MNMNLKVATVATFREAAVTPHGWRNKRKRLELLKFRNLEKGSRAETRTSEEGDTLNPLSSDKGLHWAGVRPGGGGVGQLGLG